MYIYKKGSLPKNIDAKIIYRERTTLPQLKKRIIGIDDSYNFLLDPRLCVCV